MGEISLEGIVENIIFKNEENGYAVLNLRMKGKEVTCTGIFPGIAEGESIAARGEYSNHPVYGQQFKADSFEIIVPQDEVAIERYLASGAVKGIKAGLAVRIVRRFGEDSLRIMEEEPERLEEVKGISKRMAREIGEQMAERSGQRTAMLFLAQYGISLSLARKLYQHYGERIYSVIKENPYRMAEEVTGLGFRTADEIAAKVGIKADSDFRIRCGILYILAQAAGEGHCYLEKDQLVYRTAQMLGLGDIDMEDQLSYLSIDHKIVLKEAGREADPLTGLEEVIWAVYAASYYKLETSTAKMLWDLNLKIEEEEADFQKKLARIEDQQGYHLEERQRQAVEEAIRNGLLVITGGPGTGKTTTINTIIRYFQKEGMEILLAAPTGRAAKRMTEASGWEAQTIHRLLELSGAVEEEGGRLNFERNEENPLEADLVIIDEASMVDISLMHALLKALVPGTRLILVGDVNQLPSVGPGSVLKDIIRSELVAVVELDKIFRQATRSDIVVNAHKINRGEEVAIDNHSEDFFFLKRYDADIIIRVVIALILEKLPSYVKADPMEIQVLTPMRKGVLGVERLNIILQKYINPPSDEKREHEQGGTVFREGDKVMQIRNNYQMEWELRGKHGIAVKKGMGVFNGDLGIIKEINPFGELVTIEFDDNRLAAYSFKQLEEVELAYALTIHKSQGSEYPAVIIPLLTGPRMLLNRNLLYTAVTRAKRCVTLVGNERTFMDMIANQSEQKRLTSLDRRLRELGDLEGLEGFM